MEYEDDANAAGYRGDVNAYDNCGMLGDADFDTKWSVLLFLNSWLYPALTFCTIMLLAGVFVPPLMCCGCCGHCFGNCFHLVTIIVTAVFRYQAEGELCADSQVPIFKDHGEKI